jgi:hypothetical protein
VKKKKKIQVDHVIACLSIPEWTLQQPIRTAASISAAPASA